MSRREARESESKRLHLERESSGHSSKRLRRDGKPATERTSGTHDLDIGGFSDRDYNHRRRLRDALPLEAPLAPDSKVKVEAANRDVDKKTIGQHDETKRSSDPTEVPRSRSYFQHDERGSAGHGGRRIFSKSTTERGWWKDSKDQADGLADKMQSYDTGERKERTHGKIGPDGHWNHDGFSELEAEAPPPTRKRPAFREKKIPVDCTSAGVGAVESDRQGHQERPVSGRERREERGGYHPRDSDRSERIITRDHAPLHRGEARRMDPPQRERPGGVGGNFRGRDRYVGRHGERGQHDTSSVQVEKWKHDLFDAANRSPTPKNEDDEIAKVEALLAS